ncbi:2'-5' RNA ligase [Nocardioides scoriae]|uniref:2'-5' RNA ligase n=1 Tax=Nocardioides scoriae TaxID=642780 RepID=A0A1H1RCU1_9ACTN|nr:2'-5' RNA ligase family protein [Nocardioides scoriae]SDS33587.1 2'-5' RNA ligase [Nocardioides scoriae]
MPTIGVSVAVPEPWGGELQRYRIALGDEAARGIPTHITLLPPYDVDEAGVTALVDHLGAVAARSECFSVHLRGTGSFRPVSPVVFVGVVEGISQCEQLAGDVLDGPLALDRDFPYHPHVTVAHHLADEELDRAFADLAHYEAAFEVSEMWMYRQDPQLGWQPSQAFPLGLRAPAASPGQAPGA